jgi:ATP-dependent Zn protease
LIESGMSDLGIVHPEAVTQEQWSRENARILNELTERTRKLLSERLSAFRQLHGILVQEETLSGQQLRELLKSTAA